MGKRFSLFPHVCRFTQIGQLVGDALVAVDTGFFFRSQESFMKLCGTTTLFCEIHGFEFMAVSALQ